MGKWYEKSFQGTNANRVDFSDFTQMARGLSSLMTKSHPHISNRCMDMYTFVDGNAISLNPKRRLVDGNLLIVTLQRQLPGLSLYSVSGNLEAVRFELILFESLWNLTDSSSAALPRCLSHFRTIQSFLNTIPLLRVFTRFCAKTSYGLVNKEPAGYTQSHVSVRRRIRQLQLCETMV